MCGFFHLKQIAGHSCCNQREADSGPATWRQALKGPWALEPRGSHVKKTDL